jgi:hypothetical protein
MSRSIKTRLEALEKEMTPPPATLDLEFTWRTHAGDDDSVNYISNFFYHDSTEPEPGHRTWIKEPGESYEDFRQRVRSDVLANLHPGSNGCLYYEHTTLEGIDVTT